MAAVDPVVEVGERPWDAAVEVGERQRDAVAGIPHRPDAFGRFGKFGGKYVPETLMHALTELEAAFLSLAGDRQFQVCVSFVCEWFV